LGNVGSVGDLARREVAVFEHGEVRVDLVLPEIEPFAHPFDRPVEVVGGHT